MRRRRSQATAAHFLADEHIGAGIGGFAFAVFGIAWAWINFSWFASAYDTDDWIFRLLTMVQMVFQWARAARQDPQHAPACRIYIVTILAAQVGWVALLFAHTGLAATAAWFAVLISVELVGPLLAETRGGGTPWHARHIAERYGLLIIITLGESLIGTMATLTALVGPDGPGWSQDVAVLGLAGTALTFGMWWIYFEVPSADVLAAHRARAFGWGYGHIPLFGAVAAVGAGLHAAAYYIEETSALGATATLLTVAIPLAVFVLGIYAIYAVLTRTVDPFHAWLVVGSVVVMAGALVLSAAGLDLVWSLLVLAATPWVTVVGYELRGHRHNAEVLAEL